MVSTICVLCKEDRSDSNERADGEVEDGGDGDDAPGYRKEPWGAVETMQTAMSVISDTRMYRTALYRE